MHILQLLPSLTIGGVERGVLDLAKGLIARGHRVSVVSSGGPLVALLKQLGAAHFPLPIHQKSLRTMIACVPQLTQFIRENQVDIVHARSRVPAWIGFFAARAAQKPFVTTAHGFYSSHLGSRVMLWGRYVIAPSRALGKYLVEVLGLPKAHLRIIARGVDLDAFTFQAPEVTHQGPWRIGLFGRLSPIKGHAVALKACAHLIREGFDVRLVLAGDTQQDAVHRRDLEKEILALQLQDRITWLGVREDMPELIASVDIVAIPSVYPESFGRGVIEAQAVGRAVVASRLGALPELIKEEQTGLLVSPNDDRALSYAMKRFMTDEMLRQRCVQKGRQEVTEKWDVNRMVDETLQVYEDCLTKPRILIWKLSALGDVILSTPSLRAIRKKFPEGSITLAVGRKAYEVVARCPYLNAFIVYDPLHKDRGLLGFLKLLCRLRQGDFDMSIDLQNSRRTHLVSWLAGIPVRMGYSRKLGRLLNRGVRLPRVVLTPIAHQHYLLRQLGIPPSGEALEIWPSSQEEQCAQRLIGTSLVVDGNELPLIGIHPGGSSRWRTKRWEMDRWAHLCDQLAAQGCRVVITGSPQERSLGEAILSLCRAGPRLLIGQTSVMELACVIKRCHVFVALDSAALHLAAAIGTPTVALFGPTDWHRHLPPTFIGQIIQKDVFCSPCYSPRCRTFTHACMKRIHVDEVLNAIRNLLPSTLRLSRESLRAQSPGEEAESGHDR